MPLDYATPIKPTPPPPPVVSSPHALAATAQSAADRQMQVAGAGAPLRIVLGEDHIGAQVGPVWYYNSKLYVCCIWAQGEAEGVQSVFLNGAPLPASVLSTHYTGTTTQGIDPWLAAAAAAQTPPISYTDTLVATVRGTTFGIAYSVFAVPRALLTGALEFSAIFRGSKLYDPRTATTTWTDNAGLAMRAFLSAPWGENKPITGGDVALADRCDELCGTAPNQEKRSRIGITLSARQPASQWRETLRTYAECFVVPDGAGYLLIPDAPASSEYTYSHEAGNLLDLGSIKRAASSGLPTVMTVYYTDRSVSPWRDIAIEPIKRPGVDAGTTPARPQEIRLNGIFCAGQATRVGTARLNKLWLCDLSGDIHTLDDGMQVRPGTVVTLIDPRIGAGKTVRVFGSSGVNGQYVQTWVEHDNAAYSDVVVADPSTPDTSYPLPNNPPTPTGLAAVEELYEQQYGVWSSRIRATCAASDYIFLVGYRFEVRAGGQLVDAKTLTTPGYVSPAVQEGVTYTINAYLVSSVAASATPAETTLAALGKLLKPTDIPIKSCFEVGGEVHIELGPGYDKDLVLLEARYAPAATAPNVWENCSFVDAKPVKSGVGAIMVTKKIPTGTWEILACALDSVGQYSVNPARKTVTVTPDVNSFIVDNVSLSTPSVIYMTEYELGRDGIRRWVTDDGVPFGTKFPNPINTYSSLLQTAQASEWLSEIYDFGQVISGNWTADANENETALAGTFTEYLELASKSAAVTISNATPAVVSWATHGLPVGQCVMFETTGALPAPLVAHAPYYILAAGYGADAFEIGATAGGAAINTSTAGSGTHTAKDWTQYSAGAAKTSARWGRYRIQAAAASAFSMFIPDVRIRVDAIPRNEHGDFANLPVSNASGATTITLSNEYTKFKQIVVTPIGTTPINWSVDNVLVGATPSFDVYLFNGSTNAQIANPFNWSTEAI